MMREVAVGSRRQTAERGDIASSKEEGKGTKAREAKGKGEELLGYKFYS